MEPRPDTNVGAIGAPSAWVRRFSALLQPRARVLDLACGSGRHTYLLRERGCDVIALDRDASATELLSTAGFNVICADIEAGPWPFEHASFEGVVVTNYLHRPLFGRLRDALTQGGVLIYETFALGNERYGRPGNPAFLLNPGELLALTVGLQVVAYEHGYVSEPKPAVVQRICAVKQSEPIELPSQIRGAAGGALG